MARYADPFACPDCSARLPIDVSRCPTCRIDLRSPLASELLQTLRTADDLLARLRTESAEQPATVPIGRTPYPAPTRAPQRPRGLSGASVPRILLSLGALCLLVAAVIFLAVAWTWLGVGGRTAVLVGLTLASGGLGIAMSRRGLRVAAESMTTVSLGLLALDVIGADHAGWLGDLSDGVLVAVTSGAVLAAALAISVTSRLGAPQVVASLALSGVGLGVLGMTEQWQPVTAAVVVAYAALAVLARPGSLVVLRVAALVGGSLWWTGFALSGLIEATGHATWRALWLDGHGYALLTASLLALLPLLVDRRHDFMVQSLGTGAAALLTVTVAVPAVDESATTLALTGLAVLAAWTAVAAAVPAKWRPVALAPLAVGAAPLLGVVAALATQAAVNALDAAPPFTATIGLRLSAPDAVAAPPLLAIGVAALLGVVAAQTRRTTILLVVGGTLVAASLVGTTALYPVPVWVVTAGLAAIGATLVADAVRRGDAIGPIEAMVGGVVLVAATTVALPSAGLTTLVSAVVVVGASVVRRRGAFPTAAGLVLTIATAGLVWSGLAAAGVAPGWRGLPVLVVVGLLAIVLAEIEVEIGSALAGFVAATVAIAAAGDLSTSLALHLTVAGVLVTASSLVHADRRYLGWPGATMLAAATWVRLADIGVEAPEAYTLPSALALLILGIARLRRDETTSTARALGPGLILATVPSLLWVLADPVTTRAVLLGAACLTLVLIGVRLRWSAPLVVGSAVGALLVLRELAPYAGAVPQWALIGTAGTLLTVVGITWEHRMRDVRYAAGYLRQLQ